MAEYNVEYRYHLPPHCLKAAVTHQASMSLEQLLPAAVVCEATSFCMSLLILRRRLLSISIKSCRLLIVTITWKGLSEVRQTVFCILIPHVIITLCYFTLHQLSHVFSRSSSCTALLYVCPIFWKLWHFAVS